MERDTEQSELKEFTNVPKVLNGVKLTVEGNIIHFTPISAECEKMNREKEADTRGFFQKIFDFFSGAKPYVKVRDLADPFGDRTDADAGSDGKNAVEAGIKINF